MTTTTDQTLAAIQSFRDERGYMPSLRELGEVLGLTSPDTVRERLLALEREGRIERVPGSPRAIIIKDEYQGADHE
jgi:repressor LexA